ncbi:MAG: 50S ribosomal protein L25/general stress protein Ctc [Sulfurimonas sp. RIFCSPLOWO2_12_FULL_36_74]|jgi:large subunit ribosomal protein L25|uniref:50S ribosomal protein L25/general stress protein Ctc n=1 Tax=unclassified Sulfurimonas TaxID=2623549 RepID=UPI0008C03235|nr:MULTISPECIES: 50S ribosomal protein L25/general stress protein Ctc [unclassified Sulfurimonas]OHE00571.1 MAG: 50S ribosomal protein L25/general stress protein Ctc [Sulfurimonas sp. RIFCSPLOWO2_02_FULL_36_28]OHE01214.1 MAG: 50S ribosomal protein L25/general stress protein Ctc [Sulfurimonas sp. RIFCSPLOWO2_12_36_12]OHE03833.1 MAG: 50S ribosomal protein L25/general stress protein Ctc [Sulfurimonas sp. RIFCSPLOWO2_12_FULL_36_74]
MLEGIIRESIGKKGTKALRRDGYLIANIYGKGLENIHAAFKDNEYIRTVRNKETLAFPVSVGGKVMNVVVQSYEAHPLTAKLLHVDLMVAQPGVLTHYHVPVVTQGDAIGLKNKGLIHISKPRLRVKATIENLPSSIIVDVTKMDVGDSKLLRDIAKVENVTFTDADRVSVLSIIKAK